MGIHSDFECNLCNQQSDVYGALLISLTDIPPGEMALFSLLFHLAKASLTYVVDQVIVGRVKSHHTDLSLRLLSSDPLLPPSHQYEETAMLLSDMDIQIQYSSGIVYISNDQRDTTGLRPPKWSALTNSEPIFINKSLP